METPLKTNSPGKLPRRHDFTGGDEPLWGDIVGNRFATLGWISQAGLLVPRFGADIRPNSLLLFTGKRLSGRSTGLLALAKYFRQRAWRPFLYTADERMDTEAVLKFASDGKAIVLVLDGMADIAEDVNLVIERARGAKLRIAIAAIDHQDRTAGILGRVKQDYLVDRAVKSINPLLSQGDAAQIVDKLAELGRLGVLEPKNDLERRRHFVRREIFTALASVENAPGFGYRVESLVAKLSNNTEVSVCLFAAISDHVDRTLTLVDAAQMLGMESEDVVRLLRRKSVGELVWTDGHRLLPRHRWMALNYLVKRMGEQEALTALADALDRLARRANRSAHRERNATTMFVGSLMIYKNLLQMFPNADLEKWYIRLQGSFGDWSGRYWEQRAILGRNIGRRDDAILARAESFVQRAVTLVGDQYSYTTLGTILAARTALTNTNLVQDFYDRAIDAFEVAHRLDPQNLVTWLAYLRHMLPVLERLANEPHAEGLRQHASDDWLGIYEQIFQLASASDDTKSDLARIRRAHDQLLRLPRTQDQQAAQHEAARDIGDPEGLS